jgi:hypothetical protein
MICGRSVSKIVGPDLGEILSEGRRNLTTREEWILHEFHSLQFTLLRKFNELYYKLSFEHFAKF